MQFDTRNSVGRALISGTIAGVATAVVASLAGRRETGSYAAPLNATSHVVWGDNAAWRNSASLKYTGTGFLLNHVSAIFWAALYETWFGRRGARAAPRAAIGSLRNRTSGAAARNTASIVG